MTFTASFNNHGQGNENEHVLASALTKESIQKTACCARRLTTRETFLRVTYFSGFILGFS